jgi:hypothetical protein
MDFKEIRRELGLSGSDSCPLVPLCEHGNTTSDSVKGGLLYHEIFCLFFVVQGNVRSFY